MKRKFILNVLVLIVLSAILNTNTYSQTEPEIVNVLLLNSYHDGYIWSNELKKGVNDVLDSSFEEYIIRTEHMDTKNVSSDAYFKELSELYKYKFKPDAFDIIISADDNALKFLLQYRDSLFPDTPVFFCGVNTLGAHNLENVQNIYGVVEKSSIVDTVKVAIKQNSNIENIYVVVDDTITGRSTKADIRRDMSGYNEDLNLVILEDRTIFEIQEYLRTVEPDKSIAIQSFYVVDVDGEVYPLEYTAQLLIDASPVPVYALFPFGFGSGTVGGKFVDGYSQGKRATEMAVGYLDGNRYEGAEFVVDDSYNQYFFDYEVMDKFDLDMSVLPENSIIINNQSSFYIRHQSVINTSLIIFFALVIYVMILRLQLATQTQKITKTQKDLMQSERMASLGRLVAGVAHEVNTPIGIGVTLASHMKESTKSIQEIYNDKQMKQSDLEQFLDIMQTNSELLLSNMLKASELIQSFKRVAVDQTSDKHREINLSIYLDEILNSLKSELKRNHVEVKVSCQDGMILWTHAGAIYQIVLNLIMNSIIHGFEGREDGLIEITAGVMTDSKSKSVSIKYRDYGTGMSKTELDQIYEPFFTTKRHEGGSGLGMHIVYNLVAQSLNGTIECTSAPQAGTEFLILFPFESPEIDFEADGNSSL